MKTAVVLGWPIEHSKSPQIMNAAFAACGIDAEMIRVGVPPDQFAAKLGELRVLPMLGASVTIPHKLAAHDLADELSPAARQIGAVNCLELRDGRLIGHNTDAPGFVDALPRSPKRVVLIGAGGAARAVAYGCTQIGARVDVVARTPAKISWITAHAFDALPAVLNGADLVVDCTSAGLTNADLDVPITLIPHDAIVATLVYSSTKWLQRAAERGYSTLDGKMMLVHQAARAFKIWTSHDAPLDVMTASIQA
ncbi:MAG: shikimate dehydrogenase [Kofleriaceae bacterium]